MKDHDIDWGDILIKILKKSAQQQLSVEKAWRKAAKRAQKRSNLSREELNAEAKLFLSKPGRKDGIKVKKQNVQLAQNQTAEQSLGKAAANDEQPQHEPKSKRRKLSSNSIEAKEGETGLARGKSANTTSPEAETHTDRREDANGQAEATTASKKKSKKRKRAEERPSDPPNQDRSELNTSDGQDTAPERKRESKKEKRKQQRSEHPGGRKEGVEKVKKRKKVKPAPEASADREAAAETAKAGKIKRSKPTASGSQAAVQDTPVQPKKKSKQKGVAAAEPKLTSRSKKQKSPAKSAERKNRAEGQDAGMPVITGSTDWATSRSRKGLAHGRFTTQEKHAMREAAVEYAREKGLDEETFDWLFHVRSQEQRQLAQGAWTAIASQAVPHRDLRAVWSCGTRLFHPGNYKGKWTEEEVERLKALVEEKGQKWSAIGNEIGRLPGACRDRYREETTKNDQTRKGAWTPEECASLQKAVEEYIAARQESEAKLAAPKAAELTLEDMPTPQKGEKLEDARELHDDVDWKAVALRVGTRTRVQCMDKWYHHLAPSMVQKGEWGLGDDRKLLEALLENNPRQSFLTPWGELVEGRTAQQSKRRWNLMVKRVPDSYDKTFTEQLDFLVEKFAPGLRKKVQANNNNIILTY